MSRLSLTPGQIHLLVRHGNSPRKTVKWCNTCGGKHAGRCVLVSTSHGTRVRPDLLETAERRHRARKGAK